MQARDAGFGPVAGRCQARWSGTDALQANPVSLRFRCHSFPFKADWLRGPFAFGPIGQSSMGKRPIHEPGQTDPNQPESAGLASLGRIEADVVQQGGGEGEEQEGQRQHQDQADPH